MSNQQPITEDEFWAILAAMPEPKEPFFRLYHDDQGLPLFYSMEDLPGTYIELTQQQYAENATNVRVRDGKLVPVTWTTTQRLEPGDTGTPCHPDDVSVVVDADQPHQLWGKQTYETD